MQETAGRAPGISADLQDSSSVVCQRHGGYCE
nr:MAG TPA: hypothetical protein [Caudoviricetes sp.]